MSRNDGTKWHQRAVVVELRWRLILAEGLRRISLTEEPERIVAEQMGEATAINTVDPAYMVRLISDIVPNAWVARDIVGKALSGLKDRGFTDELLGRLSSLILNELRGWLTQKRDEKAEQLFRNAVEAGTVQFRLRADGKNWRMPMESVTTQPENAAQIPALDGGPLKKSLFTPQYAADFNNDERDVAVYLDAEETIRWWHRNVARSQYAVQGWRRGKIYPDFIFAAQPDGASTRITVMETKGDQLAGNDDSSYKEAVLNLMSDSFQWDATVPAGALELVHDDGTTVHCELVLMSDWRTKIPDLLPET